MAVGKLSSRTSLRDVVIGRVAAVRRRLAEVVCRAANPCMAPAAPGMSGSGGRVHRDPLRGPTDHGDLG
jgi:hypothetical protein